MPDTDDKAWPVKRLPVLSKEGAQVLPGLLADKELSQAYKQYAEAHKTFEVLQDAAGGLQGRIIMAGGILKGPGGVPMKDELDNLVIDPKHPLAPLLAKLKKQEQAAGTQSGKSYDVVDSLLTLKVEHLGIKFKGSHLEYHYYDRKDREYEKDSGRSVKSPLSEDEYLKVWRRPDVTEEREKIATQFNKLAAKVDTYAAESLKNDAPAKQDAKVKLLVLLNTDEKGALKDMTTGELKADPKVKGEFVPELSMYLSAENAHGAKYYSAKATGKPAMPDQQSPGEQRPGATPVNPKPADLDRGSRR